tara:strand:+ start:103 stop:501 length:399 start_codon:yes stop_codon:yes gene_type:complete
MNQNDIAYMAGLFDGEGHVEYKKRLVKQKKGKNKAYRTWSIRCEMSMTDKGVMEWFYETIRFGTLNKREAKKSWTGKKPQWRWRCSYRDALEFAKLLWPYAQVKLHPLEQIIDHYEPIDNVVDLEEERHKRI